MEDVFANTDRDSAKACNGCILWEMSLTMKKAVLIFLKISLSPVMLMHIALLSSNFFWKSYLEICDEIIASLTLSVCSANLDQLFTSMKQNIFLLRFKPIASTDDNLSIRACLQYSSFMSSKLITSVFCAHRGNGFSHKASNSQNVCSGISL